jgi:hypothetical protein
LIDTSTASCEGVSENPAYLLVHQGNEGVFMHSKKKLSLSWRLYLTGALILLSGLLAAAAIYFSAGDEEGDVLGYEIINGHAYAIATNDSKMYRHDLERFGGKAAILADDLNRWFAALWTGRQLARTVAILALVLALGFFRAGWLCADRRAPDDAPED